jgi:asparagine synthetase B (glutamine-hydrolysing)
MTEAAAGSSPAHPRQRGRSTWHWALYRHLSPRSRLCKAPCGWRVTRDASALKGRHWLDPAEEESRATAPVRIELLLRGAVAAVPARTERPAVLLSSGIDSALVAAVASKLADSPVPAFTIGDNSDIQTAQCVARSLGTSHTTVTLTIKCWERIRATIGSLDELLADTRLSALMAVAPAVAAEVPSMMSGNGVDDPFGGLNEHLALELWGAGQPLSDVARRLDAKGVAVVGRMTDALGKAAGVHLPGLTLPIVAAAASANSIGHYEPLPTPAIADIARRLTFADPSPERLGKTPLRALTRRGLPGWLLGRPKSGFIMPTAILIRAHQAQVRARIRSDAAGTDTSLLEAWALATAEPTNGPACQWAVGCLWTVLRWAMWCTSHGLEP